MASKDPGKLGARIGALAPRRWRGALGLAALLVVLAAAFAFRDVILRASLDPKTPHQTYQPPPAPDYGRRSAWALLTDEAGRPAGGRAPVDVFFIHPTTYNGGEEWNGPVDHRRSRRQLEEIMLPNYAGPFARTGRLFAPRYRQASLYAMLALREDAREARRFAYADVRRAFRHYLDHFNQGRPLILVGVEQGGALAERLVRDEVAGNEPLLARLAAVYLIQTVASADDHGPDARLPACAQRRQARCVVAYAGMREGNDADGRRLLRRALVWGPGEELELLGGRPSLCVNPISGGTTTPATVQRASLGAVNATGLEWGARPAFLPRQIAAECRGGLLWVTRPKSPTLKRARGWAERQKAAGYNLFYADLEADAQARVIALRADPDFRQPAPPITTSVDVRRVPLMGR